MTEVEKGIKLLEDIALVCLGMVDDVKVGTEGRKLIESQIKQVAELTIWMCKHGKEKKKKG